jgi:hypothetical protein
MKNDEPGSKQAALPELSKSEAELGDPVALPFRCPARAVAPSKNAS